MGSETYFHPKNGPDMLVQDLLKKNLMNVNRNDPSRRESEENEYGRNASLSVRGKKSQRLLSVNDDSKKQILPNNWETTHLILEMKLTRNDKNT